MELEGGAVEVDKGTQAQVDEVFLQFKQSSHAASSFVVVKLIIGIHGKAVNENRKIAYLTK